MSLPTSDRVGGPRHYTDAPQGPVAWRCVACGEENQSPLAQGCPKCGSGAPGKHVGVDPIVRPEDRARQRFQRQQETLTLPTTITALTDQQEAYEQWKRNTRLPQLTSSTDMWLFDAFRAGWTAAEQYSTRVTLDLNLPALPSTAPAAPPASPPPAAPEEEPAQPPAAAGSFPGTARDRTLLAALRFFREQVVPEAAEEISTGEWLSVADLDQWIAELTETLNVNTAATDDDTDNII